MAECGKSVAKAKDIWSLLRPAQWTKNLFLFVPAFFDGRLFQVSVLASVLLAVASYCMASSAIYCVNDIFDAKYDSVHPVKRTRPIPSGRISKFTASIIAVCCVCCSMLIPLLMEHATGIGVRNVIMIYLVLNFLYCVKLKHIVIVDVFTIAVGFVLRLWAGGISADVQLTHWIVMMTFLLSSFLAFAKRRDDVAIYEKTGKSMRDNVNRYNLPFMNQTIGVIGSITMVCYVMYTVNEDVISRIGKDYLYTTSIFVLAGIIRYLQLTIVDVRSGSPTKILLHDRFLQLCVLAWCGVFFFIIYM